MSVSRRKVVVLAAVAGLLGAADGALAHAQQPPVSLAVINRETGDELHIWRSHGRLFVAGQPGARYSLRVTNNTDGRVLVVMSVDGVNIISGQTAGYGQRGYVLPPYQTYDATGWRKSESEVAAFNFTALSQSYAAQTGRPVDVGVIGIAVFKEKVEPHPIASTWPAPFSGTFGAGQPSARYRVPLPPPTALPAPAAPPPIAPHMTPPPPANIAVPPAPLPPVRAPIPEAGMRESRAAAPPVTEKLGTGHGAREFNFSGLTTFQRATPYPIYVRQVEYDSFANLVASGVIPRSAEPPSNPRPFPGVSEGPYVPDPPSYQ